MVPNTDGQMQEQTENQIPILHREYTSPLIFASCRDCPSYLASPETVHDLLLPAKTTVHEKWLPAETVRVILLPAEL